MTERCLLEVCVDSMEGALAARAGGADRVELCAALSEGGLTPSAGAIEAAVERLSLPVHVMLRPRRGDFSYAAEDFDAMKRDVAAVRRLGAAGVVFGILTEAGEVDAGRTRTIVELARPLSATFHRAFDLVRDPFAALEVLAGLGVDRVLTSGQEATALQGLPLLRRLVEAAAGRITVMPGGGIDEHNVRRIADATGARELHASARGLRESPARHRNLRLALGAAPPPNEYAVAITDAARVRAIRSALERRPG